MWKLQSFAKKEPAEFFVILAILGPIIGFVAKLIHGDMAVGMLVYLIWTVVFVTISVLAIFLLESKGENEKQK